VSKVSRGPFSAPLLEQLRRFLDQLQPYAVWQLRTTWKSVNAGSSFQTLQGPGTLHDLSYLLISPVQWPASRLDQSTTLLTDMRLFTTLMLYVEARPNTIASRSHFFANYVPVQGWEVSSFVPLSGGKQPPCDRITHSPCLNTSTVHPVDSTVNRSYVIGKIAMTYCSTNLIRPWAPKVSPTKGNWSHGLPFTLPHLIPLTPRS
jgi:hypothetical protein